MLMPDATELDMAGLLPASYLQLSATVCYLCMATAGWRFLPKNFQMSKVIRDLSPISHPPATRHRGPAAAPPVEDGMDVDGCPPAKACKDLCKLQGHRCSAIEADRHGSSFLGEGAEVIEDVNK